MYDEVFWASNSGNDYLLARVPYFDTDNLSDEYEEVPVYGISGFIGDIVYCETLQSSRYVSKSKKQAKAEGKFVNSWIPLNFVKGWLYRVDVQISGVEGHIWTTEDYLYGNDEDEYEYEEVFDYIFSPPMQLDYLLEVECG